MPKNPVVHISTVQYCTGTDVRTQYYLLVAQLLVVWANRTPLFRGKLLRHPNSPDLSDSLIPFSGSGKMVLSQKKKKNKSSSLTFMPRKREDRPKTGRKKKKPKKNETRGRFWVIFLRKSVGQNRVPGLWWTLFRRFPNILTQIRVIL